METLIERIEDELSDIRDTIGYCMEKAGRCFDGADLELGKAYLIAMCRTISNYEEIIELEELTEQWERYRPLVAEWIPASITVNGSRAKAPSECAMTIGQILEMEDFAALSHRINEIQDRLEAAGIPTVSNINVGGGLGIDYQQPDHNNVPDFHSYFETYRNNLRLRPGQQLHFELGRAIVGQCGTLVARVLYIKSNPIKNFCIVDAGMTDLIRPALYDAYHHIENLTAESPNDYVTYDVVGPICESSDVFIKNYGMPRTKRNDLIAFRSAGAYGEIMASCYNCRTLPQGYTTEDLK